MRKNKFLNLSLNIFKQIMKNKGLIITFSLIIVINIALGLLSIYLSSRSNIDLIDFKLDTSFFPLIIMLLLTIFIALLSIKLFTEHFDEKLITLEKRIGYNNRDIYFSRIFVLIVILSTLIITLLLTNLIFYAVSFKGVLMKYLFLNTIGWYTIWGLIAFTLVLIGSIILKPVWNMVIIMILTIATGTSIAFFTYLTSTWVHQAWPVDKYSILNTFAKQNIEKEIYSDSASQAIYDESIETLFSFESEKRESKKYEWFQKKQFLLGPGVWNDGFEINEQSPNYSEMAKYFHEIFENSPKSIKGFDNYYDLENRQDQSEFNKLLIFVKKNNSKYPFINNLLTDYFDNYLFLSSLRAIGRNVQFEWDSDYLPLIEKNYYSYYEYWFFSSINRILLSYYDQSSFSYEKDFISDLEKRKKDFNLNLFTLPGNLSLMYSGVGYGKEKIYMQVSNNVLPNGQILNLKITEKTLDNGSKFYEFKEAVSVIGLYIGYAIICITISGLMYFAFNRKITK